MHLRPYAPRKNPAIFLAAALLAACAPRPNDGDGGAADGGAGFDGGAPCRSDRECSAQGQVCDRLRGVCAQCVTQADCAMGQVCMRGSCASVTSCTSSRMCPGQVCDSTRGYCVDCVSEVDCPSGQLCRDARCVPRPSPCRSDRDCTGMGLVCDPATMVCVECVRPADCPMGAFCSAENTCQRQVCTPSARTCADAARARECNALGSSFVDTPCTPGTSCLDGACVAGPPDVVSPPLDASPPPDVVTPPPDVVTPPVDAAVAPGCPAPGDPRIPSGRPYQRFTLRGADFIPGGAGYTWSVTTDNLCDQLYVASAGRSSAYLNDMRVANLAADQVVLRPSVVGNHTVTVTAMAGGAPQRCSFVVPVTGVGLRIELCRAPATDVDLWLHRPNNTQAWVDRGVDGTSTNLVCKFSTCRNGGLNWGYPPSMSNQCRTPQADGTCYNPRIEVDAISDSEPVETAVVDQPRAGETFRFGVQPFASATVTQPLVQVFCGATRVATYGGATVSGRAFGGAPVANFVGGSFGTDEERPFWRVADVTYGADGRCTARALLPTAGGAPHCVAPLGEATYDGPCRLAP